MRYKIFFIATISLTMIITSGSGYKGKLPDLGKEFAQQRTKNQNINHIYKPYDESKGKPHFKRIPRENKTYIDIILKKDKTSNYINDIYDVIPILEKMVECVNNGAEIQKFNAIASSIIDHADYIAKKYETKPEKYYISFTKLQEVSARSREIATLRCESLVYIKYLTYQGEGEVYSKENIQNQLESYKKEVEQAIRILKDAT